MRSPDEEASQVDAYLNELLTRGTTLAPHELPEPIEPDLQAMAQLVQRALARFHPSFRFEEALAGRLALEAVAGLDGPTEPRPFIRLSDHPSVGGARIPFAAVRLAPSAGGAAGTALEWRGRGGLLLGGAIASGVSIAGAALIARARRARAEQRWQELG